VPKRVLILGGSAEARTLATLLLHQGHDVITSLAGATSAPLLPAGRVKLGGFGGREGLASFIREERIHIIADATHPFATTISASAFAAALACGIDYVRLERPEWQPQPGDQWKIVKSAKAAADILPSDAIVFLTIGRKGIQPFISRADLAGVVRMIEPPSEPIPPNWKLVLERPPFTVDDELSLMRQYDITVLVSKNAGGEQTSAKLVAARRLRVAAVIIERPVKPDAPKAPTAEGIARLISAK
jgi:precorrin-6A/cobalt-precorrin-6A reductase